MTRRPPLLLASIVALALTTARCDPPFEPLAGAIRIAARTTGTDPDTDGYTVRVDSAAAQLLSATTP